MTAPTFIAYLKRQTYRDDPTGDLAQDMKSDPPPKGSSTFDHLRDHMQGRGAAREAMDALHAAHREWESVFPEQATHRSKLVIQLDMTRRPSRGVCTPENTGLGVLYPVTADGHHASTDSAIDVADFFASEHPNLRTYVVEVVYRANPAPDPE